MEELCVRLDENTVRKVACAFEELGQQDKQKLATSLELGIINSYI